MFFAATGLVLLLGHSLGSHRKLIHDSYQCPKWLEYTLVWFGVQVGLPGPIGLLRQHELRDYAQRLPRCHDYLRHGSGFWRDGWWQLHCELALDRPPTLEIEPRIADDRFYRFLERTWMLQQLAPALLPHRPELKPVEPRVGRSSDSCCVRRRLLRMARTPAWGLW